MKNLIALFIAMSVLTGCLAPKQKKEDSAQQSSGSSGSSNAAAQVAAKEDLPKNEDSEPSPEPEPEQAVILQLPTEDDAIVENGVNSESSDSQDDETLVITTEASAPVVSITDGNIFMIENNGDTSTIYLNHEDGSISSIGNVAELDSRIQSILDQQSQPGESVLLTEEEGSLPIDIKVGEVMGYAPDSDASIELKVLSVKKGQKLDRKIKENKGRCFIMQMKHELLEKLALGKKLGHRFGCGQGKKIDAPKKSKK